MQNAKMQNAKCKMQNAKCKMQKMQKMQKICKKYAKNMQKCKNAKFVFDRNIITDMDITIISLFQYYRSLCIVSVTVHRASCLG